VDSKLIDSYKAKAQYLRQISGEGYWLNYYLRETNAAGVTSVLDRIDTLKVTIEADTALIGEHRTSLLDRITDLKDLLAAVKTAVEAVPDIDALKDDAVKEKLRDAKTKVYEFTGKITEDGTLIYEEVGKKLGEAKGAFDALPEETKSKWTTEIAKRKSTLKGELEIFIDFTDNIREKWHLTKYYQRVYGAGVLGRGHKQLGTRGRTRLQKLGRLAGTVMAGLIILQILAEDAGEKLQVIGDNRNSPFIVMVGRVTEVIANWLHIGFIAAIIIGIFMACVMGGLIAALISLAVWAVIVLLLWAVIVIAMRDFWCEYLNKSLAGDPICMILYGPAPIALTASIQGSSGTCTMAGTWAGQSEMICT